MPLHVFGHVKTQQFDTQAIGQLFGNLGLANPGGAGEKEAADRLAGSAQAGACHFDRFGQCVDGRILAEDDGLEVAVKVLQRATVICRDLGRRHSGNAGHDFLDVLLADDLLLLRFGEDALGGASFVDDIDGLVGQVAIRNEAHGQIDGRSEGGRRVLDTVMRFKAGFQSLQDFNGVGDRRLCDIDFLESPRQGMILFKNAAIFVVSRGPDALELPVGQSWLKQVGGIHGAA